MSRAAVREGGGERIEGKSSERASKLMTVGTSEGRRDHAESQSAPCMQNLSIPAASNVKLPLLTACTYLPPVPPNVLPLCLIRVFSCAGVAANIMEIPARRDGITIDETRVFVPSRAP